MGTYITTSSCSRIGIGHVCAVDFAPANHHTHTHTHTPSIHPSMNCMHSRGTAKSRSGTGRVIESPRSGFAVALMVVKPLDAD